MGERNSLERFGERLAFGLSMGRAEDGSQLSINELARLIGASPATVYAWFRPTGTRTELSIPGGEFFIGKPGYKSLADAMTVDTHWLVTGEGHWYGRNRDGTPDTLFMEAMQQGARFLSGVVKASVAKAEQELAQTAAAISGPERAAAAASRTTAKASASQKAAGKKARRSSR